MNLPASQSDISTFVENLLEQMTPREKVYMMSGHGFLERIRESGGRWGAHPYQAGGGCDRLGVPALYFTDGPRGVARGNSTCFPVTMARGATFDPDLERRIGEVMGIEARAQGCNFSGAVCINLLRHPAWGRAQETYGEDPFHLGEMGAALAEGIQSHNVIASVKHFALNSIENARFKVDVRIDDRTLREVYLPHFKRVLDAGCASVMSSYNKVNGEYAGQNRELLTGILREEWGFDGFVHSDWGLGVRNVYGASAGLDIENPEPMIFGESLLSAVESGLIEPRTINTGCRRILSTLYRFTIAEDPLASYPSSVVACDRHRAIALEAAQKSAVLLKNSGVLPWSKSKIKRIAVLGRLADLENTGDRASSQVRPPYVVNALAGLKSALGNEVEFSKGDENDLGAAETAARKADVALVVVGYTYQDEGEFIGDMTLAGAPTPSMAWGGDRESLRLKPEQVALIEKVAAANVNTVVVIVAGSAVMTDLWQERVSAILQTFYSGMEGGNALAQILLGEVSPSGKLPFTVPRSEGDLPFFDRNADQITYGPYHGYTLLEREGKTPAYAFGFGLSYTSFKYRALKARVLGDRVEVSVAVSNVGGCVADEVVQLYVGFPGTAAERPKKLLRGFKRETIAPGETRIVRMTVPIETLRWWNPAMRDWQLESGTHTIFVGSSSRDGDLLKTTVEL